MEHLRFFQNNFVCSLNSVLNVEWLIWYNNNWFKMFSGGFGGFGGIPGFGGMSGEE